MKLPNSNYQNLKNNSVLGHILSFKFVVSMCTVQHLFCKSFYFIIQLARLPSQFLFLVIKHTSSVFAQLQLKLAAKYLLSTQPQKAYPILHSTVRLDGLIPLCCIFMLYSHKKLSLLINWCIIHWYQNYDN